ncbi:hypothetical protein C0995_005194 [Termitomyces sp. Mi166|nr:hypothetical protein C0995_005194 [Termitomyces sp. Mi166\
MERDLQSYIIYPLRSVPSTKCPALPFAPFNSPLAVWAKARGAYAGGLMDTPSSKSRGGQEEGPLSSEKGSVESVGRGGVNYNYLTALAPSEGAAPSPLKGEGQGENKVLLLNTNNTNTPFPKAGLKTKTSPLLAVADADRRVAG